VIVSVLDPTQAGGQPPAPLVDIDQIEPDESLAADLRKTRVTTPFTRVLLVLIVLSVGFLGGALVDRWQRPSSSASSVQSLISSFRRGARGGSGVAGTGGGAAALFGGGGGGGAGGGATIGTVKLVDGTNVYVTDSSGNVVKILTNGASQLTKTDPATVKDVAPGETVIARGTQNSDGSYTATNVVISSAATTAAR
jgi:hypothetical protein